MMRKGWGFIKENLSRIVLVIGTVLAAMLAGLVFAAEMRLRSATAVAANVEAMELNLSELEELGQEGLESLRTELVQADENVAALEESFPEIGGPFDLYNRSYDLAGTSGVEIGTVERVDTVVQDSAIGPIIANRFRINSFGSLSDCLVFIAKIERAGLQSLAVDNIYIQPMEDVCNFEVEIIGYNLTPSP